jgi:hypothetical protein
VIALLHLLEDRRAQRIVRAHVPTALATLLTDGAAAAGLDALPSSRARLHERVTLALARALKDRHETTELKQSCALALGGLAGCGEDAGDEEARSALLDPGRDRAVRRFALVSLGRIAGRETTGEERAASEIRKHLLEILARKRNDLGHWAALGLALADHAQEEAGRPASTAARDALRARLEDASSPAEVGALSIACGLVGDRRVQDTLLEKLRATNDPEARGHIAIGLGLIRARDAVDAIRAVAREDGAAS